MFTPGRDGRGGGAETALVARPDSTMLSGRAGRAGGCSPAACGDSSSPPVPLAPSLSILLDAIEGWIGGGSNDSPAIWKAFDRGALSGCVLGRVGNMGGVSSSAVPLLLGGLLNGEILSLARVCRSVGWLGCVKSEKRAAPIKGFSARLIGGGTGLPPSFVSRSRRSSADRLGGGGDGGWEGVRRGDDLRGSRTGVWGRAGILYCFVAGTGDEDLTSESVFTKAGRSPVGTPPMPLFGGDCGGSTMSDGGCTSRGLMGGGSERVGEVEGLVWAAGVLRLETFSLPLGRVGGTGGASRVPEGLASRSRSRPGFGPGTGAGGAGEAVREEVPVGASPFLFKFSNLAKSEDTGL